MAALEAHVYDHLLRTAGETAPGRSRVLVLSGKGQVARQSDKELVEDDALFLASATKEADAKSRVFIVGGHVSGRVRELERGQLTVCIRGERESRLHSLRPLTD
jgi:hypothetical protein